jgi:hypothetical protein
MSVAVGCTGAAGFTTGAGLELAAGAAFIGCAVAAVTGVAGRDCGTVTLDEGDEATGDEAAGAASLEVFGFSFGFTG